MPPNGPFVIAGIGNHCQPLGAVVQQLRVTKQAASELIDILVLRGYLSRATDPDDRRRVNVTLTDRGHVAADAVLAGVMAVDRELTEMLGVTGLEQLRAGLIALSEALDRLLKRHADSLDNYRAAHREPGRRGHRGECGAVG